MQSTEIVTPAAIGSPIAINGDKNIPPQNATGTNTSSINLGFLPITSEPLDDGGIAPERTDFNGMFYLSTDQRVFLQNGGVITFDSAVSTKIGGYPQGAILGYITPTSFGFVESLIDNNQYNFVTTPDYINGTYWRYIPITNTIESIKLIYPVGSLYIGLTPTCPLASLFGTWQLIKEGLVLQQADANYTVGTEIPAGLPNITGRMGNTDNHSSSATGCFYRSGSSGQLENSGGDKDPNIYFDASRCSSVYRNDVATVQPPALAVNIWRRIS